MDIHDKVKKRFDEKLLGIPPKPSTSGLFYEVPEHERTDYGKYTCLTRKGEENFFKMSNTELHIMADNLASSYASMIFKNLQEMRDKGKDLQKTE